MNINKNSQTIIALYISMYEWCTAVSNMRYSHNDRSWTIFGLPWTKSQGDTYSETMDRNSKVKKWLQMFPALNVSRPSVLRRSAVLRVISLYSTTWYLPSTLHTTPTASVGKPFSTTCNTPQNSSQWGKTNKMIYWKEQNKLDLYVLKPYVAHT